MSLIFTKFNQAAFSTCDAQPWVSAKNNSEQIVITKENMRISRSSQSQYERQLRSRRLSSDIGIRYARALDLINAGPNFRMPFLGQMTEGRRQKIAAQNKKPPAPTMAVTVPGASAASAVSGFAAALSSFWHAPPPYSSRPSYHYAPDKKKLFPELDW